jgi:CheY-like chemotaxis protein
MDPGSYVKLRVADTGHGMDEATQSRLFEPFFTTKESGKGTGLGLSTVYGIVKQSGGHITIDSQLGWGTAFTLYFPRVAELPDPVRPVDSRTVGGSETILVVEDDSKVLRLARSILQRAGYTVLSSTTGDEALILAKEFPGPIALLLTDVVMPGISGRDLADAFQALRAGIPVLFASGYTDDAIVRRVIDAPSGGAGEASVGTGERRSSPS